MGDAAPCPGGSRRGVTGELLLPVPGEGPCSSSVPTGTTAVSESRKPGYLMVQNVPGPEGAGRKCVSSIVSCLVACAVRWLRAPSGMEEVLLQLSPCGCGQWRCSLCGGMEVRRVRVCLCPVSYKLSCPALP